MTEHAFWGEHDQGLAPVAQGLTAQEMEILRGVAGLCDLDIVLGGELDEALDSRAGMVRTLAFVAVGQEQDDAGEQVPLGFSGADELVDDGLRDVDEVAELGFPEDERFGIVAAVSVFEPEDSGFGKRRVVDFAAGLTGGDVFQRHVFVFVFDVGENGVALVEGAAAGVLSAETHVGAGFHQAREGERFGHAVVDGALADAHFRALFEELLYFRMNVEAVGVRSQASRKIREFFGRESGLDFEFGLVETAVIIVPVLREVAHQWLLLDAAGLFLRGFKFGADGDGLGLRVGGADVVGVDFPERRMLFDLLIEKRLRDGGVVDFAVAVAAVADEIDDYVGAELVAVFGSEAGDADDGVDVFAVDVEDRNRLAARDAGGEAGRVLFGVAGGETEEIVDDDVDGAADGVSGEVGVVHRLGEDALSGERGVAVHEQGEIFFAAAFPGAGLLGARRADGDGVDGFQVAGIRDQVDMNFSATARGVFAGRAHVVFHVAGAKNAARIDVFESGKDLLRGALGDVGDDVEAAAMAHTHDELDGAALGGGIENFVDQRDQSGDAFEGEALAAEIALLHDLLEDVGAEEQVEDALLYFFCDLETLRGRFHLLVNPAAAFGGVDVIDFDADGARVDRAGFAGVLAFALQFGRFAGAEETEGVEVTLEISPLAVGVEDAIALGVGGVGGFCYGGARAAIGSLGFRGGAIYPVVAMADADGEDSAEEVQVGAAGGIVHELVFRARDHQRLAVVMENRREQVILAGEEKFVGIHGEERNQARAQPPTAASG